MNLGRIFLFSIFLLFSALANAVCSSPAGVAGQIQWISGESKIKFCDGTNWIDPTRTTGATCSGTTAGTINYSAGTLRFCNGTDWINISGGPNLGSCSGNPAGQISWDSGTGKMRFCDGTSWNEITAAAGGDFGTDLSGTVDFCVNGSVKAIAESGTHVVFGGSFSTIGECLGMGAVVDNSTASRLYPVTGDDKIPGRIRAVIPDGGTGWFVAGETNSATIPEGYVLHVLSDGTIDPSFTGAIFDGRVRDIATDGTYIYVVGDFFMVDSVARPEIARLYVSDGTLDMGWSIGGANGTVHSVAMGPGSAITIGGDFTQVNVTARNRIARISTVNGSVLAWNPNSNSTVYDVLVHGGLTYAAGAFTTIGGQSRNYLAALDDTTGLATAWNPNPNNTVMSITTDTTNIYFAGMFTAVNGTARNHGASVPISTGLLNSWDPNLNGDTYVVYLPGDGNIYLGGNFTTAGGSNRNGLASYAIATGNLRAWNPNIPNMGGIYAIGGTTANLFIGGAYTFISPDYTRNNIAAMNTTNGNLKSWNPNITGTVHTIEAGTQIYVGGSFTQIGGTARNNIGAIAIADGSVSTWNPNANGEVKDILLNGTSIFVAGNFTTIGGQSRNRLAELNSSAAALAWNPNANGVVNTMEYDGSVFYVGGDFTNVGGQARTRIAGLNISTGLANGTNFSANGEVKSLMREGINNLWVAGSFTQANSTARNGAALFAVGSGLTSFNPSFAGSSNVVTYTGGYACFGGAYVSGHLIRCYDTGTQFEQMMLNYPFGPMANDQIQALHVNGYYGGQFGYRTSGSTFYRTGLHYILADIF